MDAFLKMVQQMLDDPDRPKCIPLQDWLAETGFDKLDAVKDKEQVQSLLREVRLKISSSDFEELTKPFDEAFMDEVRGAPSEADLDEKCNHAFRVFRNLMDAVDDWKTVKAWFDKNRGYGWVDDGRWEQINTYHTWFEDLINTVEE